MSFQKPLRHCALEKCKCYSRSHKRQMARMYVKNKDVLKCTLLPYCFDFLYNMFVIVCGPPRICIEKNCTTHFIISCQNIINFNPLYEKKLVTSLFLINLLCVMINNQIFIFDNMSICIYIFFHYSLPI